MSKELVKLVVDLKEQEALDSAAKSLEEGVDPMEIMAFAREGVGMVGEKFKSGVYFIPELVFSGEIMKGIAKLVEPYLKSGKVSPLNDFDLRKSTWKWLGTPANPVHLYFFRSLITAPRNMKLLLNTTLPPTFRWV